MSMVMSTDEVSNEVDIELSIQIAYEHANEARPTNAGGTGERVRR